MKKYFILYLIPIYLSIITKFAIGQSFTEVATNIEQNATSFISWGDYDNDNDLDVLVSGDSYTRIYGNNGSGVFTDINAGIQHLIWAASDWGDYDNDGDLDVLLCGEDENLDATTKIYINEGQDEFSEADLWLPGVSRGSATWGDYDNDRVLDILICGRDITRNSIFA